MPEDIKELAICHVIKSGSELLLIKAEEGISKGKWDAPTAEITKGESPAKAAITAVFQQTGLYVSKVTPHGTIRLFLNGKNEYTYRLHVYSTKLFTGDLKPNIKGEARWFAFSDIPFYEMWADDKYWLNHVLQGKEFEADFFFDEKNENIAKYQIREKKRNFQKIIIPILIAALIVGVSVYGVMNIPLSTFSLGGKTTTANQVVLEPIKNTTTAPTTTVPRTTAPTTTVPTTTSIPPTPATITIDNINLAYNYSGPAYVGNQYCRLPKSFHVLYGTRIVAGGTEFLWNTTIYSGACNLTISRVYTTTPGFSVNSVQPSLPTAITPDSQVYYEVTFVAPKKTYTGPLSIVINLS